MPDLTIEIPNLAIKMPALSIEISDLAIKMSVEMSVDTNDSSLSSADMTTICE